MGYAMEDIRGMRPEVEAKIRDVGVGSVREMAALAADTPRRTGIARALGLDPALFRRFVGMAEILTLEGITPRHARALFDAGIISFERLRTERQDLLVRILRPVDPDALETLRHWMRKGPRTARAR